MSFRRGVLGGNARSPGQQEAEQGGRDPPDARLPHPSQHRGHLAVRPPPPNSADGTAESFVVDCEAGYPPIVPTVP